MLGHSVRRALTLAAVVACAAYGATPASAYSDQCAHETSTRLLTAQDREYKVWIEESAGRTYVCFLARVTAGEVDLGEAGLGTVSLGSVDLLAGSIDLGDPAGPGAPEITPDTGCVDDVVDVEDPVTVSVDSTVPGGGLDVCVEFGTVPFSLTVTLPAPDAGRIVLEVDRDSVVGETLCGQPDACPGGVARFVIL